jgi:hypothetical protein
MFDPRLFYVRFKVVEMTQKQNFLPTEVIFPPFSLLVSDWSLKCAIILNRQHIITSLVSVGAKYLAPHLVGYIVRNLAINKIHFWYSITK